MNYLRPKLTKKPGVNEEESRKDVASRWSHVGFLLRLIHEAQNLLDEVVSCKYDKETPTCFENSSDEDVPAIRLAEATQQTRLPTLGLNVKFLLPVVVKLLKADISF